MAKFRVNHQKSNVKSGIGRIVRFVVMLGILVVLVWMGIQGMEDGSASGNTLDVLNNPSNISDRIVFDDKLSPVKGDVYDNGYFSFLYDEEHEQARWIAYTLTRDNLNKKRLKRLKDFTVDDKIKSRSAHTKDYSHSGYTRGHLVPSADMSYSLPSMKETYKMSNVSPQLAKFNGGIWRELEEQVRDWARKDKRLTIMTGPILIDADQNIGRNEVTVPKYFYKVILDTDGKQQKGIGFIMPNEVSYKHLNKYVVTIDQVEELTGIDFFNDMKDDNLEEQLESNVDINLWTFDNRRFELRKNNWNKR